MKKTWIVAAMAVLAGGIGITAALAAGSDDTKGNGGTRRDARVHHRTAKEACEYLTIQLAEKALGGPAEKGTALTEANSEDIAVSTCTYTLKGADSNHVRNASLLVRAPLTDAGAATNDMPFRNRALGTQEVSGYGEKAYWDPSLGQFHILKDDAWFIVTNGKNRAGERTLREAQSLAESLGLKNG